MKRPIEPLPLTAMTSEPVTGPSSRALPTQHSLKSFDYLSRFPNLFGLSDFFLQSRFAPSWALVLGQLVSFCEIISVLLDTDQVFPQNGPGVERTRRIFRYFSLYSHLTPSNFPLILGLLLFFQLFALLLLFLFYAEMRWNLRWSRRFAGGVTNLTYMSLLRAIPVSSLICFGYPLEPYRAEGLHLGATHKALGAIGFFLLLANNTISAGLNPKGFLTPSNFAGLSGLYIAARYAAAWLIGGFWLLDRGFPALKGPFAFVWLAALAGVMYLMRRGLPYRSRVVDWVEGWVYSWLFVLAAVGCSNRFSTGDGPSPAGCAAGSILSGIAWNLHREAVLIRRGLRRGGGEAAASQGAETLAFWTISASEFRGPLRRFLAKHRRGCAATGCGCRGAAAEVSAVAAEVGARVRTWPECVSLRLLQIALRGFGTGLAGLAEFSRLQELRLGVGDSWRVAAALRRIGTGGGVLGDLAEKCRLGDKLLGDMERVLCLKVVFLGPAAAGRRPCRGRTSGGGKPRLTAPATQPSRQEAGVRARRGARLDGRTRARANRRRDRLARLAYRPRLRLARAAGADRRPQ